VNEAARGSGEITSNIAGVAEAAFGHNARSTDTQKASQQLVEMSAQLRSLGASSQSTLTGPALDRRWARIHPSRAWQLTRPRDWVCLLAWREPCLKLKRLSSRREPLTVFSCREFCYATPRAFMGVVILTDWDRPAFD
jgi:hypothetical protein